MEARYSPKDALTASGWLLAALAWLFVWYVLAGLLGSLAIIVAPHYANVLPFALITSLVQGLVFVLPLWLAARQEKLQWAIAVSTSVIGAFALLIGCLQLLGEHSRSFTIVVSGTGPENAVRGLGVCASLGLWYWRRLRTPQTGSGL